MTDTRRFRTRISLDGPWEFVLDPDQQLSPDTLDDGSDQRTITVPGPWQAQFDDLRDYSGTAWYRRTFELNNVADGADQGSGAATPFIHFGAVDYHTTVWLNGQCLGAHEGGYLPFEFDNHLNSSYDISSKSLMANSDNGQRTTDSGQLR
jgi:beta-galactosidase/beta-glucuronidase